MSITKRVNSWPRRQGMENQVRPPLRGLIKFGIPVFQGFRCAAPLAIDVRPVGAKKRQVCRAFRSGLYALLPLDESDLGGIHAVLKRYRKLGAQLADAALIHLAEREGISVVFTLDRRDFTVYRPS